MFGKRFIKEIMNGNENVNDLFSIILLSKME
jgi:hypothetical protein